MRLWTDEGPAELRISGLPLERLAQASRSNVMQKHSWLRRSETGRIVNFGS